MAYTKHVDPIKIEKVASTAWTLLQREITLPGLINTRNGDEFVGALNDAVTIKVPARAVARKRALRPEDGQRTIITDDLAEQSFHITIDEDIYSAVKLKDEVVKLDIKDLMVEVIAPQVRAVAVKYEDKIAEEITSANYVHEVEFDVDNPYGSVIDAARLLDMGFVPRDGRTLIVGPGVKTALLKSPQFITANSSGDAIAGGMLRNGQLGQVAGYDVVESHAIPEGEAYLIHRSAFAASALQPAIPRGAAFGKSLAGGVGVPLTWICDYDFNESTDRSVIHFYAGCNTFEDKPDARADNSLVAAGGLLRAVKLEIDPS